MTESEWESERAENFFFLISSKQIYIWKWCAKLNSNKTFTDIFSTQPKTGSTISRREKFIYIISPILHPFSNNFLVIFLVFIHFHLFKLLFFTHSFILDRQLFSRRIQRFNWCVTNLSKKKTNLVQVWFYINGPWAELYHLKNIDSRSSWNHIPTLPWYLFHSFCLSLMLFSHRFPFLSKETNLFFIINCNAQLWFGLYSRVFLLFLSLSLSQLFFAECTRDNILFIVDILLHSFTDSKQRKWTQFHSVIAKRQIKSFLKNVFHQHFSIEIHAKTISYFRNECLRLIFRMMLFFSCLSRSLYSKIATHTHVSWLSTVL